MALPNHLVIVCGHGIWLGGPRHGHDEAEWLIESYKAGETPTFVEHICAGLQALADDERAVIAFSGGPTRKETPLSEGRSYANLAAANEYFGLLGLDKNGGITEKHPLSPIQLHSRVLVEEQALDSYYNILFSLVAFWRTHGLWPTRMTIVSHAFKQTRLVDGHCGPDAIAFLPRERVSFVGINPPNLPAEFGGTLKTGSTGTGTGTGTETGTGTGTADATPVDDKRSAMQGAHAVLDHWAVDPHGVGSLLAGKRRDRNPWAVSQRLFAHEDERQRSGLQTRMIDNDMEALAEDNRRPWNGRSDE